MPKVSATKQSSKNLIAGLKDTRKAFNAAWSCARRAPMFTKRPNGKAKYTRTNKLLNCHAAKILASGAALNAASTLRHEAGVLRCGVNGESKRAPWLPMVSGGATHVLEVFLNAYAASALQAAVTIRDGVGVGKRVSPKQMAFAFSVVNEQLFSASNPGSRAVFIGPALSKKPKAKTDKAQDAKDAAKDAEPPSADE